MVRKSMKKGISLLLAAAMVFGVAGCGGGDGGDAAGTAGGSAAGSANAGDKTSGGQPMDGDAPVAMGRYVEELLDFSEQMAHPKDLCMREDGSLVVMDGEVGMLVSKDQGSTWTEETPDWFAAMKKEETYISNMYMAPDGTVAVIWGELTGEDYHSYLRLILPDGTQVPVEMNLTEDEYGVRQVAFRDDGIIFAVTSGAVYEVEPDGKSDRLLALDYTPEWIWVKENLLFIDSWVEDKPAIYDMETGEFVADEALTEFMAETYPERNYNGSDYGNTHLLPGEDGTVYVAGRRGIHRHVIGGNMMEQIVDGSLSLLSNPDYYITDMMQLEGDVFLALFAGGKIIRFTYDPDVPAVPENMITVYSLREDMNIRQAISLYQTKHPDVFVAYDIGMDGGSSVTREDAVKKLNTQIMAGEGPDLLVMDDLPFSSYVDKGILLDLTDYLAQYSAKEPLFDNVVEALKRGGRAYVAPATIGVPRLASDAAGMENVTNLSDLARIVEKLRQEYPGKDVLGVSGAGGILKRFAGTSAPKWVSADGAIDRDVIGEYLEQCKRIYDAQMDGLDGKVITYYENRNVRMAEYYGVGLNAMDWEIYLDVMSYIGGEQQIMTGWNDSQYTWLEMASLDKNESFEDSKVVPMQGQCSRVFKPKTMLAVSAASGQTDAALAFMDAFLSMDTQGAYDGLPLNQGAFDIQFTPNPGILQEDGGYGSMCTSDEDGNMINFNTYWPADEQIAAFKKELAAVDTAYIPDTMLEDAVFNQGSYYLKGELSLEQALDGIEKAAAIYMAE